MAVLSGGPYDYIDMYGLNMFALGYGSVVNRTATQIGIDFGGGAGLILKGTGLTFGTDGSWTGGTFTGFEDYYGIATAGVVASGSSVPVANFISLVNGGDFTGLLNAFFGGVDSISGSPFADYLNGVNGADTVSGLDGDDILDGGAGDDVVLGGNGADSIRGLEDNDTIDGGAGDDDVNGNQGIDLVRGGAGNDTVRGGQGNDVIYGDDGDDGHVNGNIGDDQVYGGAGNDTLFGGQGSDTLRGEDGNDWISGDLGNDSLVGGAGADRFQFRVGSGVDVVGDFNYAAGDRVQLAPGTAYTATTVGADAVITLGVGDQIILTGTGAAAADWVVFA
jgi:Ca2+-binding RTX toxin-like protein